MKRKIAPASKKTECTRDGTRTRTAVKPADFKSAASTIPPPEQNCYQLPIKSTSILRRIAFEENSQSFFLRNSSESQFYFSNELLIKNSISIKKITRKSKPFLAGIFISGKFFCGF